VLPHVDRFDVEHGDANTITRYVHEQYDFVFSSHMLEHMVDRMQRSSNGSPWSNQVVT
jgi:hypothetical protein